MIKWGKICITLLLFCRCSISLAQAYDYKQLHFKQYDVSQGIPLVALATIYKDSYNFLWTSTYYGVSIFNGKSFTNLPMYTEKGDYLGDYPHNFQQVDSNRMLISCSNGLFLFSYANSSISHIQNQPLLKAGEKIQLCGMDTANNKIIVKVGNAIYLYNKNFSISSTLHCTNENPNVQVRNESTGLNQYYYSSQSWLLSLHILSGRIDSVMYLPDAKDIIVVNGQLKNKIIIANAGSIFQKDTGNKTYDYKTILPADSSGLPFVSRTCKLDKQGNFWIGGDGLLAIYNPVTHTITSVNTYAGISGNKKLPFSTVHDIWINKNELFIATTPGGLWVYYPENISFRNYQYSGLETNEAFSVTIANKRLYYPLYTGGLVSFSVNGETSAKGDLHPMTNAYGDVFQVENLNDEYVWLIFRKDLKLAIARLKDLSIVRENFPVDSMSKSYYRTLAGSSRANDCRVMIKKVNDQLFYYSLKNRLYRIEGSNENGFHFDLVDSLSSSVITVMQITSRQLLIGTDKMEVYALKNKQLVQITTPPRSIQLAVKGIEQNKDGQLYILTANGLYIYNKNYKLLTHINHTNSQLFGDILYAGALSSKSILWMTTNTGITALNTRSMRIYDFPSSESGILNREFNTKAIAKDSAGNIYFGGMQGVTAIDPEQFREDTLPVRLYFSSIQLLDSAIHQRMIPGSIYGTENFTHNQNNFRFTIKAVSYRQNEPLMYNYYLQGVDTAWGVPTSDNVINYMNLSPGAYTLKVKEKNAMPVDANIISYSFFISRPYWKTPWFSALIVLSVMSFIFLIVVYFMRKKLERQRIQATKTLALKTERERISRELHDDLGSGLTAIRLLSKTVLKKHSDNTGEMLESIGKISGELIDQMSEIIWLLNHMDDTLNGLLAHLRLYMMDYLQRTGVDLKLECANHLTNDYIIEGAQRRNILLIVKEAFNNVVKHAKATNLTVAFSDDNHNLYLNIMDNGIGLPDQLQVNGNGISNIKKRINAIDGKVVFKNQNGAQILITIPKIKYASL